MTRPDFVHLHVHSEYSLLDGANRIGELVKACVEDGQGSLALTDHGNMFGAIELYKKCKAAEIKPIIGCEVYIARGSRHEKHHKVRNPYNHLTLLARDTEGYKNLMKLTSLSYIEGHHFRPRIDKELLHRYSKGITCLSGCLSGEINQMFLRDKQDEAERLAAEFRDLFGPEHFWLELQRNGIEIQDRANLAMVDLAKRTGIPLVATNDIHYLRSEDCAAQDVLLCINTGAKKNDEKRFRFDTQDLYFHNREQMAHVFRDLPKSVTATMDVAEQVNLELEFGKYHLPVFVSDDGTEPDVLFDRLCQEGLVKIYGPDNTKAKERLAYEQRVIREMGFVSYFLIVEDIIRWARDHGISVGPGRGSAAGSIVAYVLDITRIDPLKYDLLFERFLNSARVSMPDIDIDFCKEGRERVLTYTREKYGAERVAQIGTFATMASRSVIRDVARVLDIPLTEVNSIAKLIPSGPGAMPLKEALNTDPDLAKLGKLPHIAELFNYSIKLDGLARHVGTHAAGVVIADRPIMEHVPLCTLGDDVVTQYSGGYLEELGLLKMDYLGLRTLTILDKALANIEFTGGTPPVLMEIPLEDAKTFELLNRGDTLGVFQLESEGMRKLIGRLRPDCFEDLIAILALYRPGPLESGMDGMFIRRKHGQEAIEYPHPSLEPILKDTYGCIVYQEQVMLISNILGNFALNEADNLRKAMGKKKPEIMEQFSAKFLEGAEANGCARGLAQEVWDNIVKFGGYGFNKSHSTAYALITWHTAYLKAHHRVEFVAANMSCEMSSHDKIKDFIDECKLRDIAIYPPRVESSKWEFRPEGDGIRFGFGAIKGTGYKAIEALIRGRELLQEKGQEITLHNLSERVDPSEMGKGAWEAIIKAGCFDDTGHNRGAVLAAMPGALTEGARAAENRRSGQGSLFGGAAPVVESVQKDDGIDDSKALEPRDTLRIEHEVLGFYLSGHPLEERAGLFSILSTTNTRDLPNLAGGTEVTLGGLVVSLKENITRKGKKMARFRLEDLQGGVQVTVFPRTYEEMKHLLVDDSVIICKGKLEERDEVDSVTEVGMLLDSVMDLEAALLDFRGGLMISLTHADHAKVAELSELVKEHRGEKRLFLEVEGADGELRRIRTDDRHRVRISADFATSIDKLLGPGKAKLARI